MRDIAGEDRTKSYVTFSYRPLYMDAQVLDGELKFINNHSVRTQNVAKKTYRKLWTIETKGERDLGKSVLAAGHKDDDDI